MAKRIGIEVPGVRLNETGHAVLSYIASRAREVSGLACKPVGISRRDFTRALGVSETGSIRACHSLESNGLIASSLRSYDDGGQASNTYMLTALGIEVLRLADEAVAEGRVGSA